MSNLPEITYLDSARTEGELKTSFYSPWLDVNSELPGGAEEITELTISTGSITPIYAAHTVDTEGDVSTDDLTNIVITNMPEARRIILRAEDGTRSVVLKHLVGGSGQISISTGQDLVLDNIIKHIELMLVDTTWVEIGRAGFNKPYTTTIITSSTSYAKVDNLLKIEVELVGGGGGAGGVDGQGASTFVSSGGGGGGGYSRKVILASALSASETVTIGAGGAGGAAGNNDGTTGGTTSFGSHLQATGGIHSLGKLGSTTQLTSLGGVGGGGSSGNINTKGESGHPGIRLGSASNQTISGIGGSSFLGAGAIGVQDTSGGVDADDYGGGGGGGSSVGTVNDATGGDGYQGIVIIKEFFN